MLMDVMPDRAEATSKHFNAGTSRRAAMELPCIWEWTWRPVRQDSHAHLA